MYQVKNMVLARMSAWSFKEGKREEGFSDLDANIGVAARGIRGFRGYMMLLSRDDPNTAIVIGLWADEESLKASEEKVMEAAKQRMAELVSGLPKTEYYRVFSFETKQ